MTGTAARRRRNRRSAHELNLRCSSRRTRRWRRWVMAGARGSRERLVDLRGTDFAARLSRARPGCVHSRRPSAGAPDARRADHAGPPPRPGRRRALLRARRTTVRYENVERTRLSNLNPEVKTDLERHGAGTAPFARVEIDWRRCWSPQPPESRRFFAVQRLRPPRPGLCGGGGWN